MNCINPYELLGVNVNSTLKELNNEIETLDLKIKYFGFRWWHVLIVKKKFKKQSA